MRRWFGFVSARVVTYAAKDKVKDETALTGMMFEPLGELQPIPSSQDLSFARQHYHPSCEAALNDQINVRAPARSLNHPSPLVGGDRVWLALRRRLSLARKRRRLQTCSERTRVFARASHAASRHIHTLRDVSRALAPVPSDCRTRRDVQRFLGALRGGPRKKRVW